MKLAVYRYCLLGRSVPQKTKNLELLYDLVFYSICIKDFLWKSADFLGEEKALCMKVYQDF
jgi:hypothetical protein